MPKVRKTPQRRCVVCGQTHGKRDLLRVVRTPTGDVRVDLTGKVSGRGAYVCPKPTCIERALREGRLAGILDRPIGEAVALDLHEAAGHPVPARVPVVRRISLSQRRASEATEDRPNGMGGSS
jgi:uncharacterized protein